MNNLFTNQHIIWQQFSGFSFSLLAADASSKGWSNWHKLGNGVATGHSMDALATSSKIAMCPSQTNIAIEKRSQGTKQVMIYSLVKIGIP